jgi:hypothetical protein
MIAGTTVALKIFLNVLVYALQFVAKQSLVRMNMENVSVNVTNLAVQNIAGK